jgi:site-specific DNA-methyltransferase (adenine-specific)
MRSAEFADFALDIKERGVRVPLELQPGTNVILDGRCRYLAAKEAGIDPVPVVEANLNGDDPVVYMIRAASKRRQLSDDQRAMMAEAERQYLADKARKERASKAGRTGGRNHPKDVSLPDTVSGKLNGHDRSRESRGLAARHHNVSERKAKQAQKVARADPQLAEKVTSGTVPLAQAVRQVEREQKRRDLEEKVKAAEVHLAGQGKLPWEIRCRDCMAELDKIEPGSVPLIVADPPYNIGVDYGDGPEADRLRDEEYLDRCLSWLSRCKKLLTPTGSLWVLIGDEYAGDHSVILKRHLGLTIRAWIKWYETFGVNCSNNFNRCSRHLLYCVKHPRHFTFHAEAVRVPSARLAVYDDSRADPDGKIMDDVWLIPRLTGTCAERIPGFPTQLPLDLLRPVIAATSNPGELVLDPFSGSATTGAACIELGRRYLGIEKEQKFADLSIKRLKVAMLPKDWTPREKDLRSQMERGLAVVVNMETDHALMEWARQRGCYVRVDRRTPWGNPFRLGDDGSRDQICEKFVRYFADRGKLRQMIHELRGKALGCHCAPLRCHADHLAQLANQEKPQGDRA